MQTIAPIEFRFRLTEIEADKREIENWKKDRRRNHQTAASSEAQKADIQAMVGKCITEHGKDTAFKKHILLALKKNQLPDIQYVGDWVQKIFKKNLEVVSLVQELVKQLRGGTRIAKAHILDRIVRDYQEWLAWLERHWPWVNHKRLQKSYRQYLAGKTRSTRDFLNELRNSAN